jgi:hypothetical protein
MVLADDGDVRVRVGGVVEAHARRQLIPQLFADEQLRTRLARIGARRSVRLIHGGLRGGFRERLAHEREAAEHAERPARRERQVESAAAAVGLPKRQPFRADVIELHDPEDERAGREEEILPDAAADGVGSDRRARFDRIREQHRQVHVGPPVGREDRRRRTLPP